MLSRHPCLRVHGDRRSDRPRCRCTTSATSCHRSIADRRRRQRQRGTIVWAVAEPCSDGRLTALDRQHPLMVTIAKTINHEVPMSEQRPPVLTGAASVERSATRFTRSPTAPDLPLSHVPKGGRSPFNTGQMCGSSTSPGRWQTVYVSQLIRRRAWFLSALRHAALFRLRQATRIDQHLIGRLDTPGRGQLTQIDGIEGRQANFDPAVLASLRLAQPARAVHRRT